MQWKIDADNGVPIYEQLVNQFKYSIAEGSLVPGQLVPSVRELAKQLTLNPNTVQRAFQQLQSEEILEALRGRGLAVCQGAKKKCLADRQSQLGDRLSSLVNESIRSGLEPERLREMFERSLQHAIRTLEAKP